MRKRAKEPRHDIIAVAQADMIATLPNADDDSPTACCWACGYAANGFTPTRAHLVAHVAGGSNAPTNYLLLCEPCHREQPDGAPRDAQIAWARGHAGWLRASLLKHGAIVEAIRLACDEIGIAAVRAFVDKHGFDGIGQIMRDGARTVGSLRESNIVASAAWAVIHALRQSHRAPVQTEMAI